MRYGRCWNRVSSSDTLPLVILLGFLCSAALGDARAATLTRRIAIGGTSSIAQAALAVPGLQFPELAPGSLPASVGGIPGPLSRPSKEIEENELEAPEPPRLHGGRLLNRSFAKGEGIAEFAESKSVVTHGATAAGIAVSPLAALAPPTSALPASALPLSFNGIDFVEQRLAGGGNQFSVEPSDGGLCVGNGYVLQSVNSAVLVFDTSGKRLIDPITLNSFYGYAPVIERASKIYGTYLTDPSCYYDPALQRWFQVALALDTDPATGAFTLANHLDIAVSTTSSPLGHWNIYHIPVQDDGTQGTPVHPGCPCLGDYPHIGADAYGFYISTNEYSLGSFNAAQIYAISKASLAAGSPNIDVVQIDTTDFPLNGFPGFTVWPASGLEFNLSSNGTEFLVSSLAVWSSSNTDTRLQLWALTNTQSLQTAAPALTVQNTVVDVASYGVPPVGNQKAGNHPLADCINDVSMAAPGGSGCWRYLLTTEPAHNVTQASMDTNDSRIQQVVLAGGQLYTALDTIVNVGGVNQAGIAYYIITPGVLGGQVAGTLAQEGRIALAGNNVAWPAIAALPNGKAVMSFSLFGADYYPSAAYVVVDPVLGAGGIQVSAAGVGPQDGFSGYPALSGGTTARWGDYSAAVSDGVSIWVEAQYVDDGCPFPAYTALPFGNCGGTRSALGNWDTRITQVLPQ